MKRTIATLMAAALAFSLCPAGVAFADDAAIADAKAKIEAIQSVDPMTLSADDGETIAAINAAQASYDALPQADKDTLDNTKLGKQSYGRVLESAVWSVGLTAPTDNATDLPDGSYPGGVASQSDKGKYVVTTVRTWSVSDVTVKAGKAFGTIKCNETGKYPKMRIGDAVYDGIIEEDSAGNHSRFEDVPLKLDATMSFAVSSSYAGAVVYQITTTYVAPTIDEEAAANVTTLINALPAPEAVTLADADAIEAVKQTYEALSDTVKALVGQENKDRLDAAVAAIEAIRPTAITDAKAKIEAIYDVDPLTLSASDNVTLAAIDAAQAAYDALPQADKDTLDNTPYDGSQVTEPPTAKPWGRVLEAAVWSKNLLSETHESAGLPDGSYPAGVLSTFGMGKYHPKTKRPWTIRDVYVKDGKAYGTFACEKTGTYKTLRIFNQTYEGILDNSTGSNWSRFEDVPINLNATMTFGLGSNSANVPYQITTSLDDAVINTWVKANADAASVVAAIDALPANVTLANLDAVEAAVRSLASLSNEARALVPQTAIEKLDDAVKTLGELADEKVKAETAKAQAKANATAAAKVTAKIKALPKTVVDTDKSAVAAARKTYNALNASAKKLVTNYKTLTAAEKAVKSTKTINKATVTSKLVKKAAKKGITTIVLGSKVKTVKSKAFKSAKKVKTLVVKSKKLEKSKVKNSLKSSNIKTVKVVKSKKSAYKKIFTKKNSGKKVTLKAM